MSSVHSGGVGTPGVPGPEAEIRRLRRRVIELEETNRELHEMNRGVEELLAKVTRERDEARETAATEVKRANHHAAEHAAAVKAQKGGRR